MFGEFGLYYEGKFVGSVCDNELFLKMTPPGRAALDASHDAPPYPGAKPGLRVPVERWDDRVWLAGLIRATAASLPEKAKSKSVARDR
jgi:TfoX/Sxy family transcriptional regulator of competence genes